MVLRLSKRLTNRQPQLKECALLTKSPPIVVLGLDKDQKPRAATFSGNDLAPATKAASVMGLQIGRAESPEAIALVKQLPLGRVFATGKGLMPLAKRELYEKLLKVLKLETLKPLPATAMEPAPESAGQKPPSTTAAPTSDPGGINIGSVVLCRDPQPGPDRSWWECVVQSVNGKNVVVRWQKFPTLKPFTVQRDKIALLPTTR